MSQKIFISYRREDSRGDAGRLADRLTTAFGKDNVFIDVDTIGLGVNFVKALQQAVAKCDVLLAVIGPRWLDAKDDDGSRRLENPNDFVRIEIAAALAREIPVVPVLLDGTDIPKVSVLPPGLIELSQRNGIEVRHASFHADVDKLIRGLTGRKVSESDVMKSETGQPPSGDNVADAVTKAQFGSELPTPDMVIAAGGAWTTTFAFQKGERYPPIIFDHFFVAVTDDSAATVGSIVRGQTWDGSDTPLWWIVHGHGLSLTNGRALTHLSFNDLTYLGPLWSPRFASISSAIVAHVGSLRLPVHVDGPNGNVRAPTAIEAIEDAGLWVQDFAFDNDQEHQHWSFDEYFMVTDVDGGFAPGSIVTGDEWPSLWRIVNGSCSYVDQDGIGRDYVTLNNLTYLGSAWRPEYAQLGKEVFNMLGGKKKRHLVRQP